MQHENVVIYISRYIEVIIIKRTETICILLQIKDLEFLYITTQNGLHTLCLSRTSKKPWGMKNFPHLSPLYWAAILLQGSSLMWAKETNSNWFSQESCLPRHGPETSVTVTGHIPSLSLSHTSTSRKTREGAWKWDPGAENLRNVIIAGSKPYWSALPQSSILFESNPCFHSSCVFLFSAPVLFLYHL